MIVTVLLTSNVPAERMLNKSNKAKMFTIRHTYEDCCDYTFVYIVQLKAPNNTFIIIIYPISFTCSYILTVRRMQVQNYEPLRIHITLICLSEAIRDFHIMHYYESSIRSITYSLEQEHLCITLIATSFQQIFFL